MSVAVPISYAPLPDGGEEAPISSNDGKSVLKTVILAFSGLLLLAVGLIWSANRSGSDSETPVPELNIGRGIKEGVSEKSVRMFLRDPFKYSWTNDMLVWQRTAFHFQPEKNWMNATSGERLWTGEVKQDFATAKRDRRKFSNANYMHMI